MLKPRVIYTDRGSSRVIGFSESRGPQLFEAGVIPTEFLINGTTRGVSAETLAKLAPTITTRRKRRAQ